MAQILPNAICSKEFLSGALNGKNVCIVDDDEHSIEILTAYLRGFCLNIKAFNNPIDALDYLNTEKPDVLLLDVMMPEMDGWEAFTRIRGIPRLAALPVLFVTCLSDPMFEAELKKDEFCASLGKPIPRITLLEKIASLLEGQPV
ncbi:MAG: response regulator [Verrucomicrobiota bacterium]